MRVLLISQRGADQHLIAGLLDNIAGASHELTACKADPEELSRVAVPDFRLILWGDVPDTALAMRLLGELNRHEEVPPIIVISDDMAAEPGNDATEGARPDILPRSGLTENMLRQAILAVDVPLDEDSSVKVAMTPDPLTGLSNRQTFREQLASVLSQNERPGSVGLMLIDVDQFKKVNASYGQGAGDALIQLISERIRNCLSPNQRLARIGGNEFAVVFQHAVGSVENEVRHRVDRIVQRMARPFPVAQHAVRMHVSIGVVINNESVSVDEMLSHADMAMRIAKQDKGSNCQFYTRDMTDAAQQVLKLEAEIRRGLRKEEFELHFQPRVDISGGRVVGAEALIRWRHPTRGLLPPSEFIAVAEDSGLIVPLGYWIIHNACRHLNELAERGFPEVQIAVNVAFKQFQDRNFVQTVANILEKHSITPGRLEFELTETTMMVEGQSVDASLRKLSRLGIDISLDDFGTGYSSFAHIQRLPISTLKVDRTFVSSATLNEDDATIVKAIINLAHSLNMQVIAEGAETPEQIDFLGRHRCDQIQGYYFSRPVAFPDLLNLLLNDQFVSGRMEAVALVGAN